MLPLGDRPNPRNFTPWVTWAAQMWTAALNQNL